MQPNPIVTIGDLHLSVKAKQFAAAAFCLLGLLATTRLANAFAYTLTDLAPLPDLGSSQANAINDSGQVVGRSASISVIFSPNEATIWNGGIPTALPHRGEARL